jgi:hypothetical protein
MFAGICVEVLIATIVAWVGVWGIVDETVQLLESRLLRYCVYALLLCAALLLATLQQGLTVCALL